LITGFLFLAALPSPADAACPHWDVSDIWIAKQSNHHDVEFILSQDGTRIWGTARETRDIPRIQIEGTMIGNQFSVTVFWSGGTQGVYRVIVDSKGKLAGTTYDKNNPSSRATWVASRAMKCRPELAAPPSSPPQPKPSVPPAPLQTRERATERTPPPPPIESTPVTSATIKAVPQLVSIPDGKEEGFSRLVWSAGNQHPNAQLMVKVDGGDEEVADPQSKGSRNVRVEAGRTYLYMVVDAGKRLAAVTVLTNQSAQRLDRPERRPRH
jgi:hypothetical protein